jgi:two-component system KDP operon response regulator KdpE
VHDHVSDVVPAVTRILVVDDEPDVTSLIALALDGRGRELFVSECNDSLTVIERIADERPDMVILDLAMPGRDGFSILEELRRSGNDTPVIVLTAKGLEQEKVRGLELGADDYVTKPFSVKELAARVDAVLRRYRAWGRATSGENVIERGEMRIDVERREVRINGRSVSLTPTEFNLLRQLAQNAGRVMEHRALLAKVWGREYRDEVHYLKVYVGRLRNKIEADAQHPRYIETVRGVGYRFVTG